LNTSTKATPRLRFPWLIQTYPQHQTNVATIDLRRGRLSFYPMTNVSDLSERRSKQKNRIRQMLNTVRAEERLNLKGGEDAVAWVKEELCIGCDQCTIVCDDEAIELYDTPLASPILNIDVNRKARVLNEPCTGCKLCVLACPTDAIIMIDR